MTAPDRSRRPARSTPERGTKVPLKSPLAIPSGTSAAPVPPADAEDTVNAARTPTACGLSGPSTAAALDGFEAASGTALDAGQRGLVTSFACDSRLLLAGIGPAGSGKTTATRALEYMLRAGGHRLVPLGTSADSADVLGRELGVRAENLHKFLANGRPGRSPPGYGDADPTACAQSPNRWGPSGEPR